MPNYTAYYITITNKILHHVVYSIRTLHLGN